MKLYLEIKKKLFFNTIQSEHILCVKFWYLLNLYFFYALNFSFSIDHRSQIIQQS